LRTGMPKSWSAIVMVTKSRAVPLLVVSMVVSLCRATGDGGGFRQRAQQRVAVELGDVIGEADLAAAVEIVRTGARGQRDQRGLLPAAVLAHFLAELEAVHARHLDVADDDIEVTAGLAHAE